MTDYVKSTNFASKDALATGNPLKIVKGTEIDTEFNNIATAVATKADLNSPAFIGTPTLPTGTTAVTQSAGNNTTAVATTAFVKTAVDNYDATLTVSTSQIEDNAVTTAKLSNSGVTAGSYNAANITVDEKGRITSASVGAAPVDVQTFNSTTTWNKPTGGQTMARIQVWGGGGGGGRATSFAGSSGGGGGAYNEVTVPLSFLAASLTATVGAGGLGRTGSAGNGTTGGTSSVPLATSVNGRSAVEAFGGGPGASISFGGGGGGQLSAGLLSGASGNPVILSSGEPASLGASGGFGNIWGGGGGSGGSSVFGGAAGSSVAPAAVSVWGGNGGVNSVGIAPGGGGGCSQPANGDGSNGAAGRVIITCW